MAGKSKSSAKAAPVQSAAGARAPAPQALLQVFLDYLPSGVTLFAPDLEMVACNARLRELLEFPDELFAHGLPSLPTLARFNAIRGDYGPGDPEEISARVVERARKMEPHAIERTRPNGTVLEIRGTPLPHGGFVTTYTDITERKRTEKALRGSEAELRLLTDNVPAMILYVDRSMRCVFANKRYADFFGLALADFVGKPVREIVGDAAYGDLEAHFRRAFEGEQVTYQRMVKHDSGEERCIEVKLVPRMAARGQTAGCYSMATDITEQKRAEERIQHLAHHDSLTGLPNRLLFNDRLKQAISFAKRDSRRIALLYLDLDRFKLVNDTLGHSAGDEVLRAAAARIQELLRESDTVARVGGDEFTVILHDISSRENIRAIAEKIVTALGRPFRLKRRKRSVDIGTSIGIALYPDDAREHESLIRLADAAMYDAKKHGSCFRFAGTSTGTVHS